MATYTLTLKYGTSNSTIVTNCGTTGVYKNGSYWYKITSSTVYRSSTSATSGFSQMTSAKTATSGSSGTSKSVYWDLLNIATPGLTRTGYHTTGTSAWKTPGGLALNEGATSATATNAPTVYRLLDNAYISANKTVTIQPNWVANTYTITYNANGGSGVPGNQTATYNSALTLSSSTTPTRTGYTFLGWNTSSTATSATYTAGQALTATEVNGLVLGLSNGDTRTLYAVWEPKTTPIAFDMNGGTGGPPSPVTATYDQTFTIPTAQPTSNKYFMGWAYAIGVNGQAATSAAHSRADSRIIDYIGGESFTWTAAGGYGVYCAVWSPIAVKTNSYQWERLFQDRDAVSGNPVILEDGETIGLQSGSYWYKINSTYTGWTSISTPSSYTNFSNNYNDCNPKPVSAPTSYTGDLDKERYASINGVTYGYIESSTSNYDYTSLYKLESSWRGTFPKIKVNGVWKDPTAVYVKVNGTWKQLY